MHINAHARVLEHTCSHTLFVRARVCAQDADFAVLPFLQPMSTTIYVYPSAWNTRMEMCHTCRWECDSCSKAWALRRFIYCFNDAVCFIFMYFVRKDAIKTVNWANFQQISIPEDLMPNTFILKGVLLQITNISQASRERYGNSR